MIPRVGRARFRVLILIVVLILVPGLLAMACDAPGPGETSAVVTDSAGVRIVESPAPRYPPGSWDVVREPEVLCTGGGPSGDPRVFRIWSLVPLADGAAAALAGQARSVLVCRDGEVVAAHGGPGDGPGEFATSPQRIVLAPGDSVAVLERSTMTMLSLAGGETRRISIGAVAAEVEGASRYIAGVGAVGAVSPLPNAPGRAHVTVLGWPVPSGARTRIPDVPWSDAFGVNTIELFLWNPSLPLALEPGRYFWGDVESGELRVYDASGLTGILRFPASRPEADASLRQWGEERAMEELLASNPTLPEDAARSVVEVEGPVQAPAIVAVLPTPHGELWIEVPQEDPRTEPRSWRVLSAEGEWVTDVELPREFSLRAVDQDMLYGVRFDALQVESVERLRLRRP